MKANCWLAKRKISVEQVPDPGILNSQDAIVKITSTAICGSDLNLYNGFVPGLAPGDILGHEFMGEVVEIGKDVKKLRVGDRVVVPSRIACGRCFFCAQELYSWCENSNPNAFEAEKLWGHVPAGLFGYSHLLGGFAGGQAEYARVPFADIGPIRIDSFVRDEQVLFLSDVFPAGYMAAEQCNIRPGDTVAVWGCGPVGLFAIKSAFLLGAERVIAIDRVPERLRKARFECGARIVNYEKQNVLETLKEMTGGRGADSCIDALGLPAHMPRIGNGHVDQPAALHQAILACRIGGTVSIAGMDAAYAEKIHFRPILDRWLQIRTGQTHVHKYLRPLLERIQNGEIDPSFVVSHRMSLDEAPEAYQMFLDKPDECLKIVLKPGERHPVPRETEKAPS